MLLCFEFMLSLRGEVYTKITWRYFYFLFVTVSQFHYNFSTLFYHLYKCYQLNYYLVVKEACLHGNYSCYFLFDFGLLVTGTVDIQNVQCGMQK